MQWLQVVVTALLGFQTLASFIPPFDRSLELENTPLSGPDVVIAQTLLGRCAGVPTVSSGKFDEDTKLATIAFQKKQLLTADGVIGPETADALLHFSADGYKDDGQSAGSQGYLYKLHIPVHRNRSLESVASLFDANNTLLHSFTVRTHGHDLYGHPSWPDFNNTDPGRSQLASSGNTPTGLSELDLNTPEPDPKLYGPYPVNRFVRGLKGNAALLLPSIRDGVLVHTGEWPGWTPSMLMPNSAGCVHGHPDDIKQVASILQKHGVVARPNPGSGKGYKWKPQGLVAVELVD